MKTLCGTFDVVDNEHVKKKAKKFVSWWKDHYGEPPEKADIYEWLDGYVGTKEDADAIYKYLVGENLHT